jgi:hypothetical protein
MKLTTLLPLFFIGTAFADDVTTTRCTEHRHVARIQSRGFEHVSHRLLVDGINIKEIENGLWFIESIKCIPGGFSITASHVQYDIHDTDKQVFVLKMLTKGRYELRR